MHPGAWGRRACAVAARGLVLVLGLALLAAPASTAADTAAAAPGDAPGVSSREDPTGSRPNILLISSDDQADLEMRWMPRTRRLLGEAGIDFTDAINPHPLCCPARAEILTGEYAQNNGVRYNRGPFGGYEAFLERNRSDNLATWLQDAGYRTGFIGKSLNGYRLDSEIMDGWDYWSPMYKKIYGYYGTGFYDDGEPRTYDGTYAADVVRDQTDDLIRDFADRRKPFFIWASHIGPHTSGDPDAAWNPPIPARRDRGLFRDVPLPTLDLPSFDEADVSDKPVRVRRSHRIEGARGRETVAALTHFFRERIRSLQAIDRANASAIRTLRRTGELDDTLVVYVTDNGFLLGQHRQVTKDLPYEGALQIPMLMRGPGVPAGTSTDAPASLVDLAPTFLDLAGALNDVRRAGRTDGESLLPTLTEDEPLGDTSLIQAGTTNPTRLEEFGWEWRGVRTERWTYTTWWNGFEELYDRERDPYQLTNLAEEPAFATVLAQLRARYAELAACAGPAECERDFGPVTGVPEPFSSGQVLRVSRRR